MKYIHKWLRSRHVLWLLMSIVPLLLAAADTPAAQKEASPAGTTPAVAASCASDFKPEFAGSTKYQVRFDSDTVWQARNGTVLFTVYGLDAQKSGTLVTCLRSLPHDRTAPNKWSDNTRLIPYRVNETPDKTGMIYAVTIPRDFKSLHSDCFLYPPAELRVILSEPSDRVVLDTVRTIKIAPKWFAGLMALFSVFIAAGVLCKIARCLNVPGTNVVLRVVTTASGWASLAQFQIVLWTLIIGGGAVYVVVLNGTLIPISTGVLALLGISGAAALGSQLKSGRQTQPPPNLVPPGPVDSLDIKGVPGESDATIFWSPPSGGGAPGNYIVQYKKETDANWITASTAVVNTRFKLVGLEPGINYSVQVIAANAAGQSSSMTKPRSIATAGHKDPPAGAPAVSGLAPRDNATATSITLAWTAIPDAKYTVKYRAHDGDQDWLIFRTALKDPVVTVDVLRANTDYDFQVCAANASGTGQSSYLYSVRTGTRMPRWSDLVMDAARTNEIDVTRVQMLFFTVISACFVTIKIATSCEIPEIPESYVALMGISNGVYITAKFAGR